MNIKEETDIEEEFFIEDEIEINLHHYDEFEEIKLEDSSLSQKLKNLTTDTKVIFLLSSFGTIGVIFAAVISCI